jgi:Tol biopolymer transport system component
VARLSSRKPSPRGIVTFTIDPPPGNVVGEASVSPDGTRVAIWSGISPSGSKLWIRNLDDLTLQPVAGTDGGRSFNWSPDGRKLAFFIGREIRTVDLSTGATQALCSAERAVVSDWGDNGMILFRADGAAGHPQVFEVPATGGSPKTILPLDSNRKEVRQGSPKFLPGGSRIVYYSYAETAPGMYVASLDGAERKFITSNSDGRFIRDQALGRPYLFSCTRAGFPGRLSSSASRSRLLATHWGSVRDSTP